MTPPGRLASIGRVTLTDFLMARSLEALEAHSCDYFVEGDRVICNCAAPSEGVEQVLDDIDLIRWSDRALGPNNPVEALLADQYATHPAYNPDWHFLAVTE
jgi:hypothetical protein